MRVLITGGSGFVGQPLVYALEKQGHTILALSRKLREKNKDSVTWLNADLSDPLSYQDSVKSFSPEVLIHLAWQDIPDFSLEKSQKNLKQSLDLFSFVLELGECKKIMVSGSCFEVNQLQGECKETNRGSSKDNFTWAKHSLHSWLEMMCQIRDIQLAWMRIFYVYGPRQRRKSLIPTILTHLKEGKLPDLRTPNNSNDFIFVDDVVNAFKNGVTSNYPSGIYNLGSGKSTPVLEICRIAEQIILGQEMLTKQLESETVNNSCNVNFWADTKKSKEFLNWQPSISIMEGVERTWNWLQQK